MESSWQLVGELIVDLQYHGVWEAGRAGEEIGVTGEEDLVSSSPVLSLVELLGQTTDKPKSKSYLLCASVSLSIK